MEKEGEGQEGVKKDALKLCMWLVPCPLLIDEIGWKRLASGHERRDGVDTSLC